MFTRPEWPETMPYLLDAKARRKRETRRKLWMATIRVTAGYAVVLAAAVAVLWWGMS